MYSPSATGTARVQLEFLLVPLLIDLDVFVLDASQACGPAACVYAGVEEGPEDLSWPVTAGSEWYIVVDGAFDSSAIYDLLVTLQ